MKLSRLHLRGLAPYGERLRDEGGREVGGRDKAGGPRSRAAEEFHASADAQERVPPELRMRRNASLPRLNPLNPLIP